jgi:hypothetical protein
MWTNCQITFFANQGDMKDDTLNAKPFEYESHYGTKFFAKRCDFRTGLDACWNKEKVSAAKLVKDVMEMAGYHAANILPRLNGFAGYDCVEIEFRSEKILTSIKKSVSSSSNESRPDKHRPRTV